VQLSLLLQGVPVEQLALELREERDLRLGEGRRAPTVLREQVEGGVQGARLEESLAAAGGCEHAEEGLEEAGADGGDLAALEDLRCKEVEEDAGVDAGDVSEGVCVGARGARAHLAAAGASSKCGSTK
jgi:hypothetical protein